MVKPWMKYTLFIAGIYNALWGAWVILFPELSFTLLGAEPPKYLEIWQCVGMIVAVYGLGYFITGYSPVRYWPIVLVGLLGKIFGPIGFAMALIQEVFPLTFGVNIIFNDLIWWIPFTLILKEAYSRSKFTGNTITIKKDEVQKLEKRDRARLINSLAGFKPVNLVGTINSTGLTNLSIVSSVFHLGADPALLGFIIRPDTVRRDTLENIRENGLFTINQVSQKIYHRAHQTSARYDQTDSEFKKCDLTPDYRDNFLAPFVKESPISYSVKLIREEKIPENNTHFMIGEIQDIYLPQDCLGVDKKIDLMKAGIVTVSGLDHYFETIPLERLSYAKPDKELKAINL